MLCNNVNSAREVIGQSTVYTITTLLILLLLLLLLAFIILKELDDGNANIEAEEKATNNKGEVVEIPLILCVTMA